MTETAILKIAAHELTHFIQANSAQYEALKSFVVNKLTHEEDMSFENLVADKQRREPGLEYDEAVDEEVADACEMMLKDSKAAEQLAKENRSLARRIADWLRKWVRSIQAAMQDLKAERPESRAMLQYAQELQKLWDNALVTAARNNRGAGESYERNSIRNVEGVSGKDYGVGVYLDSALLENLTDTERIQMVKERIRELGGKHFAAYNMSGEKVDIQIAESGARFVNKSGKSVPVNNDLATKNRKSAIKQETVVLADEMISAARHKKSSPARYSHGWLDNNGQNDWEEWKTYVQDRGGSVWEATLHIATAKTGQKYLYDIDPIKMVEQSGKSDTSTTNHSILQSVEKSQAENSGKIQNQQRDNLKEEYHLTDDEESAIISYKSGDSYTLNGKLTARAELTEYQRNLRDNLDAALEKLPVYRGEVYRHYNFDDFGGFEAMMEFLELFEKDEPTALGGYLSCSTVHNEDRTGGKYTVNMVIQSESGRRLVGFGRNTENEILLPRNTRLVPYRMERMGPTSIRIYVREETISETGKTNDSALSGVRGMREGTQRSEDLRQVPGGDPGKVQSEVGRSAGRDGDRGGMPGLREGEGSASLDATGVAENHRGLGTRGGEGEGVKNQQRDPRLSDRDVLRMAADMAQRDRNQRWSVEDLNRFDLLQRKLLQLDEANAELEALKEERKVLLAGRKVKELTRDEQFDLAQNRNRTETQKGKMFVNRIQRVARNNIS